MSAPALARQLYDAFSRRDGEAMAALYAPQARFDDPVFPGLDGAGAGDMWRMLCARGKDLEVRVVSLTGDEQRAQVRWVADYTFSTTGRRVHNEVTATLEVEGGRIVSHRDDFDFPAWARQAFGLTGRLLGDTGLFKRIMQRAARSGLTKWQARRRRA